MRETRADDPRYGRKAGPRLNPADPFMVRQDAGHWPISMSVEQRRTLRRIRSVGGRLPRRELRPDVLASLLRARVVAPHGDLVELTTLGALALTAPVRAAKPLA